jgi:ribonuclease R
MATSARSGDSIRLGDRMVVEITDAAILRRTVYAKRVRGEGDSAERHDRRGKHDKKPFGRREKLPKGSVRSNKGAPTFGGGFGRDKPGKPGAPGRPGKKSKGKPERPFGGGGKKGKKGRRR